MTKPTYCSSNELQTDADRPNVELARLAGLSPAATLNRVRRLKESGVIEGIHAKLDREQAGFGLCVYVSVTLGAHEEALERRFQDVVARAPRGDRRRVGRGGDRRAAHRQLPRPHRAAARAHPPATKGGAQRVVTLLRLRELKPDTPLPLGAPRRLR